MRVLIATLVVLFLMTKACPADAGELLPKWDIVSRIGFAYKDLHNNSFLVQSACKKAAVFVPRDYPDNPRPFPQLYSCGGDNPAFVGYPIALKREWRKGAFSAVFGLFHQSQWFDNSGEIQWTGPAAEFELNWSQMKRNRRARR